MHPSLAHLQPQLSVVGAGVAVVDFDNDGRPDVFLHSSARGAESRLFRNNGDGTFSDAAPAAGLADINQETGAMRALFFDFDNDGWKDLVLTTFGCPRVLRNRKGRFTDVTASSRLECGQAPASNALDFDEDGFLDLVIGYRRTRPVDLQDPDRYDIMNITPGLAHIDPGRIVVYRNRGGKGFYPIPGNLGISNRRGFTHAIGVYDLRGTGRRDLYIAMDMAPDKVFFNEGDGRFLDGSAALRQEASLNGMSAEIADIDDDGRPAVFVTNIHEPERSMNGGNLLWKAFSDGSFRESARLRGVGRCGYAWGAKFLDLDNDGDLELAVSNGMISGDPSRDYWPSMEALSRRPAAFQLDARNWPPYAGASLFGREQKCLFIKEGARFRDRAEEAGMADRLDGRGLAAIDIAGDGKLSLLSANQAQPVRLYLNETRSAGRWMGFSLEGGRSNRDAWGTRVSVRLKGGRTLSRELEPANGYAAQSDARLHFGLGRDPEIESVEVRWPGGEKQELRGFLADRYHPLREPPPKR